MTGKAFFFLCFGLLIGVLGTLAVLHSRNRTNDQISPALSGPAELPPSTKQTAHSESPAYKWVYEKTNHGWVSRKELVPDKERQRVRAAGPSVQLLDHDRQDRRLVDLRLQREQLTFSLRVEQEDARRMARDMTDVPPEGREDRLAHMEQTLEQSQRRIAELMAEIGRIDAEIIARTVQSERSSSPRR
jgi:hypothetical protein